MNDDILLSVSIPTYNRKLQLKELVESLIAFKEEAFEIVVTDNMSTDGTLDMLNEFNDSRLKIFQNKNAVPGYYNMIISLFNATGKYVIHCNDRDQLYLDGLQKLFSFLKKDTYSFVQTTRSYPSASYNIDIYRKGYPSLYNQYYSCHPTGMVFNRQLMDKYINKKKYLQYVEDTFTYCFLMRDLLMYEKSARYECGCWNERDSRIKLQLKSGSIYKGGLYFEPDRIVVFMKSVINHICDDCFALTLEEKENIVLNIFLYFKNQLVYKKVCYADIRECYHYGIKKKHIGYIQLKKIYNYYLKECDEVASKLKFDENFYTKWNNMKKDVYKKVMKDYISAEKGILYKKFKRITDNNYPY